MISPPTRDEIQERLVQELREKLPELKMTPKFEELLRIWGDVFHEEIIHRYEKVNEWLEAVFSRMP